MLVVQPLRLGACEEELTAVRVGAAVGHGQQAGSPVLQKKVFVGEVVAVYGDSSRPVAIDKITSLYHEVFDYPVEGAAFVSHRNS